VLESSQTEYKVRDGVGEITSRSGRGEGGSESEKKAAVLPGNFYVVMPPCRHVTAVKS